MRKTNKKSSAQTKGGFTIIEVTLVTAFMAMLLIAIALILTSMISIYQKGMTLKAINSTGRNLISELTNSINSAPSIDTTSLCNTLTDNPDACIDDGAFKFIYQSIEDYEVDAVTGRGSQVQYGGVFCTGDYSYVWNTKYGIANDRRITVTYRGGSTADFKIARFRDRTYRACSTNVGSSYSTNLGLANRTINVTQYTNGTPLEISDFTTDFLEDTVDESDVNLTLYELTIFPVSQDAITLRGFFSGTFILGTERGNAAIMRSGDYCDVTNTSEDGSLGEGSGNLQDLGSEFNYCGINKFNFAARTAGSGI